MPLCPSGHEQEWLAYQRHDVRFRSKWPKEKLSRVISDGDLAGLEAMDNPRNLAQLAISHDRLEGVPIGNCYPYYELEFEAYGKLR